MYDLDPDFREQELTGHYLEMVCIGPYFTRLEFSMPSRNTNSTDSFYIGVKGQVRVMTPAGTMECNADFPKSMVPILELLLDRVSKVEREGGSSLLFTFDSSRKLVVIGDSSSDFENYTIQVYGKNVVIV
jgi:hypothetical protein